MRIAAVIGDGPIFHSMDWEIIRKKAEVLDEMPERIGRKIISYNQIPSPDSKASQELKDCQNKELLEGAYNQGVLLLLVSSDHMSALRRTLKPTALSCAPWTCARVVLESCSTGIWLLDTGIDSKERITRSLDLRLEEHYQQINFCSNDQKQGAESFFSSQETDDVIKECKKNIENLKEKAEECGIAERESKKGKRKGEFRYFYFGSGRPRISDRIAFRFTEKNSKKHTKKNTYALLSGVAHSNQWAVGSLSMETTQQRDGFIGAVFKLNPDNAEHLIENTVEWFARTSRTYFSLFGWDLEELWSVLEDGYDQVGFNEESRFWR